MIYLNQAASTYPKPDCVLEAVMKNLTSPPVSQFRDSAELQEGDLLEQCRKELGELLHIMDYQRICFTSGATQSLNQLIGGLDLDGKVLFATETEHNSVLRPLMNQPSVKDQKRVIISCEEDGEVTVENVDKVLRQHLREFDFSEEMKNGNEDKKQEPGEHLLKTENETFTYRGILFLNHCSNVTGRVQDAAAIGQICHQYGVLLVLDLSQSAGCIPVDVDGWQVDAVAFTGHKSLFGIQGTGGFWVRKELKLRPMLFGGTGKDSAILMDFPEWDYEVGTRNMPGMEALLQGVRFLQTIGVSSIQKQEEKQMERLYRKLGEIPGVQVYGRFAANCQGPVISFNLEGMSPSDVGYILKHGYDIVVRTGLHCAPLHHRSLGTEQKGTVRVSVSCFTKEEELNALIEAVREIAASITSV